MTDTQDDAGGTWHSSRARPTGKISYVIRSGRPPRLSEKQLQEVNAALRLPPEQAGLAVNLWDGKALAQFLQERYGVVLGVRQCQRLFRQLGFRLRKPRSLIAQADPERQQTHKKNSRR